ncbi:hypothetical protein ANN_27699 [Periplaneta americana]|uniref:Uncharacterized protein n=1 Tax=Periplaneta americana TaxID=6978 RepID=A0ABQ8RVB6_PERAM|nr:hypothetical protein ANN_27699 [Periplaneta americana]
MDVIKKESEVDPLAIQWSDEYDTTEKKPVSEKSNILDLQVVGIKTENVDHSCDLTSNIEVEETAVPTNFVTKKCKVENGEVVNNLIPGRLHISTREEDAMLLRDVENNPFRTAFQLKMASNFPGFPQTSNRSYALIGQNDHPFGQLSNCGHSSRCVGGRGHEFNLFLNLVDSMLRRMRAVLEEELCNLDIVKDELKLEVTTEENEILTDSTNPKSLLSAYEEKAMSLLIVIHLSDGDVKPGGSLGAIR